MSYSLRPSIGPINRPPPWRRGGFHSFQGVGSYVERPGFNYEYATAGLGDAGSPVSKSARDLQQMLIARGFNVGSTGADGAWGRNSQTGLNTALGRTVAVTVTGTSPNQVVTLPYDAALQLSNLPLRSGGGSSSGGGGSSSGGGGGSSTTYVGPSSDPVPDSSADTGIQDGGINWGAIWPWAVGAGAFVALGGFFLVKGSKRRPAAVAAPAAVTANRRRSRRRRSRR